MRIILADFDFQQVQEADAILGPIFFFVYIFFVFIILVVTFFTLIQWSPTRAQFHQRSKYSFYMHRSQKCKNDSQVVNLFYAFGIYECKRWS